MHDIDPLAVISTEKPNFSDAEAIEFIRRNYDLDVAVKSLLSERDQNFQLSTPGGEQYVLKIANSGEDPQVADFHNKALLHLKSFGEQHQNHVNAPAILLTCDGATKFIVESGDERHIARVVSFVAGIPLADRIPSTQLCHNLGAFLARLGLALKKFTHPASNHSLLWDMQQALSVRRLLPHVPGKSTSLLIEATLREFEENAVPLFSTLRTQVIHNDLNPDNVLINPQNPDEVVGVIDFGDMLRAPLIVDVAIAASYLRQLEGDPLVLIAGFVSAYHSVVPLTSEEIDILHTLIKTRLATSIAILHWRASAKDESDSYLVNSLQSESSAQEFLRRLAEIPGDYALRTFRSVCASVDCAKS
jgi:Ser/Thr protein kinase RdoA (MazF antagonist)